MNSFGKSIFSSDELSNLSKFYDNTNLNELIKYFSWHKFSLLNFDNIYNINSSLSDDDRISLAESILSRKISISEWEALICSHNFESWFNFKKWIYLRRNWFSVREVRILMDTWLVWLFWFKKWIRYWERINSLDPSLLSVWDILKVETCNNSCYEFLVVSKTLNNPTIKYISWNKKLEWLEWEILWKVKKWFPLEISWNLIWHTSQLKSIVVLKSHESNEFNGIIDDYEYWIDYSEIYLDKLNKSGVLQIIVSSWEIYELSFNKSLSWNFNLTIVWYNWPINNYNRFLSAEILKSDYFDNKISLLSNIFISWINISNIKSIKLNPAEDYPLYQIGSYIKDQQSINNLRLALSQKKLSSVYSIWTTFHHLLLSLINSEDSIWSDEKSSFSDVKCPNLVSCESDYIYKSISEAKKYSNVLYSLYSENKSASLDLFNNNCIFFWIPVVLIWTLNNNKESKLRLSSINGNLILVPLIFLQIVKLELSKMWFHDEYIVLPFNEAYEVSIIIKK